MRSARLFCFIFQILLLSDKAASLTQDDEAFVQEMWDKLEEQDERQLLFGFGGDKGPRSAGAKCSATDQCEEGLECSPLSEDSRSSRCMANKQCLQDGLKGMSAQIDPVAYKQMILDEAQITEADLWSVRREFKNDDTAFASSAPVKAFMASIENHREELTQMAHGMADCTTEPPKAAPVKPASVIGTLEDEAVQGRFFANPTVSSAPSVSKAPSAVPSAAPSRALSTRTYLGFHMEGGFLVDGSFSLVNQNDRNFGRLCLGWEFGVGAEVSLIIMIATNRFANDIIGGSFLVDSDIAVGLALGAGTGVYVTGDMADDVPMYFETTIGGGLGFGVAGFSICRTARNDPQNSSPSGSGSMDN